ncbi:MULTISPECIES: hypothetical protein [Agrobacterium]|uniref:Uncharacterized protein n=1 Tax=Agrobacterium tumefaciens TaxID=358 RepID=A0AAE6EIJ3_AGRTU|nr:MULTISPECIES: hypothetical protein [Agrobacterium]QCL77271.1 hypothetical protein CFBP5499_27875 [Agrobacterium tumefaciens]QCL82776.1 hypothetical protein CFBP5877_27120 [Agrobacterium tumefaciens]CUX71996.1 conserved hypothetical protein [Agrobacterium sp. NCPPB 925]
MNELLKEIPDRILKLAKGALSQANTHLTFADPGNEHWNFICVLNAAHAGELFMKAAIAREHPLLIFKDLFAFDDGQAAEIDLASLIKKGKTHDFDKIPQLLWAVSGIRIPNRECFERLRKARNAIQHFCAPDDEDFRQLSLEFSYTIIDPLIQSTYGLFAIDFHEDHNVGYDYVVEKVVRAQQKFSMPEDFNLSEVSLSEALQGASRGYKSWINSELTKIGRTDLLTL